MDKVYYIYDKMCHKVLTEADEIYKEKMYQRIQEYEKKLEKEYLDSGIIFNYSISDAWFLNHISIKISNMKLTALDSRNSEKIIYPILEETVQNILKVVRNYHMMFRNEEYYIESNNWLDGAAHRILLSDGETYYYIRCFNLEAYDETYPNAYQLYVLIKEIFEILRGAGIDERFLNLSFPY